MSCKASCLALSRVRQGPSRTSLAARVFRISRAQGYGRISRAQGGRASCQLKRTVRVEVIAEVFSREAWIKGGGGGKGRDERESKGGELGRGGGWGSLRTFFQLQLRGQFRFVIRQTSFEPGGEGFLRTWPAASTWAVSLYSRAEQLQGSFR